MVCRSFCHPPYLPFRIWWYLLTPRERLVLVPFGNVNGFLNPGPFFLVRRPLPSWSCYLSLSRRTFGVRCGLVYACSSSPITPRSWLFSTPERLALPTSCIYCVASLAWLAFIILRSLHASHRVGTMPLLTRYPVFVYRSSTAWSLLLSPVLARFHQPSWLCWYRLADGPVLSASRSRPGAFDSTRLLARSTALSIVLLLLPHPLVPCFGVDSHALCYLVVSHPPTWQLCAPCTLISAFLTPCGALIA